MRGQRSQFYLPKKILKHNSIEERIQKAQWTLAWNPISFAYSKCPLENTTARRIYQHWDAFGKQVAHFIFGV